MKKLAICLLFTLSALGATAQTEFRSLTYQEALTAAATESKLVFIDFYTTWCGPCKAMAKNIFPQKQVGDFMNAAFVCIKLDAEKEGKDMAQHYKVQAYPTMVIVDAKGEEVYRKVGGTNDPDEFVAEMKAGSNPMLTPEKMRQRYDEGDRSAELVNALANTLFREATETRKVDTEKLNEAKKIVGDYFTSLSDAQRQQDDNFFVYSYNFVDDPKQPQAQYLFNNVSTFPAEMKEKADAAINKLLRYRMGTLLQGHDQYSQEDVDIIADAITKTGIGEKNEFVPTIATLTAQLQGEEKYFAAVQKYYNKMNISDQINVAGAIANVIKSTDKTFCTKVNKWLRSKLPIMDFNAIYYAAMSIRSFERRINPDSEN